MECLFLCGSKFNAIYVLKMINKSYEIPPSQNFVNRFPQFGSVVKVLNDS